MKQYKELLSGLLEQPTAPFQEQAVISWIQEWAARQKLPFRQDTAGNVLVEYRKGRSKSLPHWVLAAHMDHPGFQTVSQDGRTVEAVFFGGVAQSYFKGAKVALHRPQGVVKATVQGAEFPEQGQPLVTLRLGRQAVVPPGTLGMWDLPPLRIAGGKIISRACDDVVGCASVLCAMERIAAAGKSGRVTALLTRAEEAAFIGALAACEAQTLPVEGTYIVAVETSKAQPAAQLGQGVVIRVGDRARVFDPDLTAYLVAAAGRLAKADSTFKSNTQLMPGGVCESTAYSIWGYRAGGLCLAMENYHNQGEGNRIMPEAVSACDFDSLVKLLAALPADSGSPAQTRQELRSRLEGLLQQRGGYLKTWGGKTV